MRSTSYRILKFSANAVETELMQNKWEKEFDKLEEDLESFRDYYNHVKKCKCDIDECKHFEIALNNNFKNRIEELWNLRLQVGFRTVNSVYQGKR